MAVSLRKVETGSWVWSREYGELIPKAQYMRGKHNQLARSALACPAVVSDNLDAMKSMADGRIYTSKRAYYDSVRRAGCQIVGNEDLTRHVSKPDDKAHEADVAADVRRAMQEVASK